MTEHKGLKFYNIDSKTIVHIRDRDITCKPYINEEPNAIFLAVKRLKVLTKYTQAP